MDKNETIKNIGRFLTAFNELEAQTYIIIALIPQDSLTKYVKKIDRFEARVKFIQALLKDSPFKNAVEISQILERALALTGFRNKLSHNPMRINIFQKPDGDLISKEILMNSKNGNNIPQLLGQLPTKLEDVNNIVTDLFKFTSEYSIVNTW